MSSKKNEILLHDYFDNLLTPDEMVEFEEYLLDNIDLAIELGKLKNLQRNLKNLPSNFSPPDTVIENIISSLLNEEEKNENLEEIVDANQIDLEEIEEIEEIEKPKEKKKKKKKKIKKPLSQETKIRIKKIVYVFIVIIFLGALGYGYYQYDEGNKTTPWKVNSVSSQENQKRTVGIELNSILETSENEQLSIQISDKGRIKLFGNTKIKIKNGTQSLNSIVFYFGKLTFSPSVSNELFEVFYNNFNIKSVNSEFTLIAESNNLKINVLSNFITFNPKDFNWSIPANYEIIIFDENKISIPINKNSSAAFRNLIKSYSLSFNDVLLKKIIKISTLKEAFTLHFLLPSVAPEYRELIIEKLNALAPMPQTTSKEKILILDQAALDDWWEEIYLSTN